MPCLNEEKSIVSALLDVLAAFDDYNLNGEVVVVNDGSTDASLSLINQIHNTDARVRVIDKARREGVGAAFWDGVQAAQKDFIVMIPGDNENQLAEVLNYYSLVHMVDIIVPFIHNVEVRKISRRFISGLYRLIINLSFGTSLNYTNGTVVYNKDALLFVGLRSRGFFFQTELLITLLRWGFLYAEVPQSLRPRKSGKSTALAPMSILGLMGSFLRLFCDVHIRRIEGRSRQGRSRQMSSLPDGSVTGRRASKC